MCRTKLVPLAILEPVVDEEHHLSSSNNSENDAASPCPIQHQHGHHNHHHAVTVAPTAIAPPIASAAPCKQHLPAPSRKNLSNRYRQIKPWPVIELPEDVATHMALPAGFKVEVYDGHLTQHFEVDSGEVVPTVGALSYVQHFNETGPYGRFRFQLCHNYACGRCAKGFGCTYLHINKLPAPTVVHVQGGTYEMMPAGVNLFVHTPHSQAPPQVVPSEYLIQTQGALTMMQTILEGKPANVQRPQHCAHFQYKRMCNRGYECGFLHSTIPAPR